MQILAISDGLMEGWMRQLVVGNWKMNGTQAEAVARINALAQGLHWWRQRKPN
jgi:triosephosphate isomerase